jgi:hypothetical protein
MGGKLPLDGNHWVVAVAASSCLVSDMDTVALPKAPQGWFDYRYYVLSDGALGVLLADRHINTEYKAWAKLAGDPSTWVPRPDFWAGEARLYTLTPEGQSDLIPFPLVTFPELDRFPDGRWLVASSLGKPKRENGLFVAPDGRTLRSLPLGDAIEHLRCAPDGSIWIGYFDEGIFGEDLGAGGIAHFSTQGEPLWSYNKGKEVADSLVFDCYALALDGNDLWSCFYNDFPIVRVADGRETLWANSVAGAKALAVDGEFVVLAGGYRDDATRLALLKLGQEEASLIGSYDVPEMANVELMQGRSSTIHFVGNGDWRSITVAEVRATLDA